MGIPQLSWYCLPLAAALAVLTLFVLVELGQLFCFTVRASVRQLNRVAPPRVSMVVAVALLVSLSIALLNSVVVKFTMRTLNVADVANAWAAILHPAAWTADKSERLRPLLHSNA